MRCKARNPAMATVSAPLPAFSMRAWRALADSPLLTLGSRAFSMVTQAERGISMSTVSCGMSCVQKTPYPPPS